MVAVSGAAMPPNQTQIRPVRGGEAPPPLPHEAKSHNGLPKLVEVSTGQFVSGMPPFSNPPSTITSLPPLHGVELGVAVAPTEALGVGVMPGVGETPPPQLPLTLNTRCMFGNPMPAVVVGVVIPQAVALR